MIGALQNDPDHVAMFLSEARLAAGLSHRHVVQIYELGEDRGVPFIAMEMLPGVDLEALLRSGEEIPLAEKLDVIAQVCRGLAYAHDLRGPDGGGWGPPPTT